jgi:hypothetical protein
VRAVPIGARYNANLVSSLGLKVDTTWSTWLPFVCVFTGDPGKPNRAEHQREASDRQETLAMTEQPKPQPKPERPDKDSRESARAALQMSMDRRY